jgi:hypothetical protein
MGIAALALVMTLVQGFDGLIGALAHDPASTYGPFCFRPREPRCTGVVAAFTWKQQRLAKIFRHAPQFTISNRTGAHARTWDTRQSKEVVAPAPTVGSGRRRAHTRALVPECAPDGVRESLARFPRG